MQIPVKAIWVFHAAAKAGSVSRAAEEFGVTPSAVTQQIQALEVQLGVSLLTKMGRRVALTEAGERYFATITDEIERISEATSTIRGYRSVTMLTVRATPTLSNKWLLPRLASFLDQNPELEIRLDGTSTESLSIWRYAMATAVGLAFLSRAWPRKPLFRPVRRHLPLQAALRSRT